MHITVCFFDWWPKQNVNSFLTPVAKSVFYHVAALRSLAFHWNFSNHVIGLFSSSANKNILSTQAVNNVDLEVAFYGHRIPAILRQVYKNNNATMYLRTKCRPPCESAWKNVPEAVVKSDLTFCLRPPIEKTYSKCLINICWWHAKVHIPIRRQWRKAGRHQCRPQRSILQIACRRLR